MESGPPPSAALSRFSRAAATTSQPGALTTPSLDEFATFAGWLILPSGKEIEYQKNSILDQALSAEYTYDEGRAKRLEWIPMPLPARSSLTK